MRIKKTVQQLVNNTSSNDPFQIAEYKNIIVVKECLGEVYGYFHTYKRIRIIHINSALDHGMQKFVCAHELGHAILHPNANTPFMKAYTFFSVDRLEREANKFAVELLMPDEVVREYQCIYKAAMACGVPKEVAKLKRLENI